MNRATFWIETTEGTGQSAQTQRHRIDARDSAEALRIAFVRHPGAHTARVIPDRFMRKAHRAETIPDWYGAYLRGQAAQHHDHAPDGGLYDAELIDYRPELAEKARRIPQKKQRKVRQAQA